jgi:hypothetical protein
MRFSTFSVATLLLTAGLLAASGGDAQARRKDPFAELRTSIDKLFTPQRRARRAKRTSAKQEAGTPAKQEQPTAPKAASKPAPADQKSHPAEPAARPRAAAEKPPERGRQAEPRPVEPERRASRVSREERSPPPATKRAVGAPLKEAATAQNRPALQERGQQAEAPRRGGPTAAPPPPTERGRGDDGKARTGAPAQAAAQTQPQPTEPSRPNERVAALPPPTKRAYGDAQKVPAAEPEEAAPAPPPPPSACQLRLTGDRTIATATMLPRVTAGQCVVDDVVRLEAVMTEDGKRIALAPPPTLRCPMAEAVVQWLREDVAPVARELGAGLKSVAADTSFECRSRNHIAGAKLSEHGHANAIDLRGITLTDGTVFRFTDAAADREARESLRKSACARFTTVLGPGSDGYHETHIHLDLAQRRGGYRMCQWDVRDPTVAVIPMPPERPSSAPPRSTAKPRVENR